MSGPCDVGFKCAALQLCGVSIDNAAGFDAEIFVDFHEIFSGVRMTPCVGVDKVRNTFMAYAKGSRNFVTPGTSGTCSGTVLKTDQTNGVAVSMANGLAGSGRMSQRMSEDGTWEQGAKHNPGGTETLNPISVS